MNLQKKLQDFTSLLYMAAGEIFGGLPVLKGKCDSKVLLGALTESEADVVDVLSRVQGPWALVYWQHQSQTLWMGRDALGQLL